MLFLLYYGVVMYPRPRIYDDYTNELKLSLSQTALSYMKLDPLVWLLVACALGRTYLILRRKVAAAPLWDGLALGGLGCLAAYLYLGVSGPYYLAPVDLIAVLYVGRFTILAWSRKGLRSRLAIVMLLGAVVLYGIALSAFWLFQRKNLIHAKAGIASVIEDRFPGPKAQRLFFPFASAYVVYEFAAYLNYRGIPVEGEMIESAEPNYMVMVTRAVAKDGPCVHYASVICHAGDTPESGDLVIVMPDDDASRAEVVPYRNPEELVFSSETYPRIPQWLRPFVTRY